MEVGVTYYMEVGVTYYMEVKNLRSYCAPGA